MVVMTAKVSKAKLIAFFCVLAAVICIVAYALFGESDAPEAPANAADNDARIAFLASYGWEVDPTPTEMQDVRIPEDMNEVFAAYNELQRTQGFDLTRFSGQTAQRYVYQITNYSDMSAPVYASLLIVDGAVIGGDITSTAGSGTMHGFEAPAGSSGIRSRQYCRRSGTAPRCLTVSVYHKVGPPSTKMLAIGRRRCYNGNTNK